MRAVLLIATLSLTASFSLISNHQSLLCKSCLTLKSYNSDDDVDGDVSSSSRRRDVLATFAATTGLVITPSSGKALDLFGSSNDGPQKFTQAKRPTAYFVDSTKPPTLVPYRKSREAAILKQIGAGFGTSKTPLLNEEINLNNIANKGLKTGLGLFGMETGETARKAGTSFVFLGADLYDKEDASLTKEVITDIIKPRRGMATALGLAFAPLSTQEALDSYLKSPDKSLLLDALVNAGIEKSIAEVQIDGPIEYARQASLELIAMAPEVNDIKIVREEGLQNLSPERRSIYVTDPEGFIGQTQDPKFKLYTERSMMRDFVSLDENDSTANFFAERILVDEAVASSAARWAILRPDSIVIVVAPITNVRFMGGANGRVERICKFLSPDTQIDEESITTILLNPNAEVSNDIISQVNYQIYLISNQLMMLILGNSIRKQIFKIGNWYFSYKYGLSNKSSGLHMVFCDAKS